MSWVMVGVAGVSFIQQAQQGQEDARTLRAQARVSNQQATADSDAMGREARQLIGRQAAAMAQNGGTYEGSNAKLIAQTETLANLDRLKTIYRGNIRALGLNADSDATLKKAYVGAGTSLLSSLSGAYTGGKTMPGMS